jgi:acyl-coenzyme A thioesterase PaaI-like protein
MADGSATPSVLRGAPSAAGTTALVPRPDPVEGAFLTYPDPQLRERARAAAALRLLSEALVGHAAGDEELEELSAWAEECAARLRAGARLDRAEDYQRRRYLDPAPPEGVAIHAFSDRPISGPANPSAVDLVVRREGRESVGIAIFDRRFESSPGRVHGGITASVFDDVMGYVNVIEGVAAYTWELTVRYLAGMPLGEPVELRARMTHCDWETRRSTVTAEAHSNGVLVAEATASFALLPPSRFGL